MNGVKSIQIYEFDYDDLKCIYGDGIIKNVYNGPRQVAYIIAINEMELKFYIKKKINNLKITATIKPYDI